MGLRNNYDNVSGLREYRAKKRDEEHRYKSKIKLSKVVERKFKTCFIGAIDSIEHSFGYLWGKDIDRNKRTSEQVKMLKMWLILRSEILDKGNAQLRGVLKEIEEYDVDYEGKKMIFNIGDE